MRRIAIHGWLLWTTATGSLAIGQAAWAQAGAIPPGRTHQPAPGGLSTGGAAATAQLAPDNPDMPITLEQLERRATEQNPTIRQAAAAVEVAKGLRKQAGLYPNPVLHYHGEEIGQAGTVGQHGPRLEQTIVTGGKLRKAREVRDREVQQAEAIRRGQVAGVLLNVRVLYYQALAAQERITVRTRLLSVATETVETSRELHNIGVARESELLQAQVEAERARLALNQATAERARVWQQLGAMVGDPQLTVARILAGTLEALPARLDPGVELQRLLEQSPDIEFANAGVGRAEAMLRRQRAERVPNLNIAVGPSYDFNSRQVIGEVDLALPLPLFNRNQGNIQAARAEVDRARAEVERVRLSVRNRFGPAFTRYETSLRFVEDYRTKVLPTAARAHELALEAYRRNAESFDQVLSAQRTFFQTQADYIEALQEVQESLASIRGFFQEAGLGAIMPAETPQLPEMPVQPFP